MSSITESGAVRKCKAPPIFTLPLEFQPEEFLPRRLRRRGDDARWAVATIVNKMAHHQVDPWGFARLSSSILRKTMSWRAQPAVMRALVARRWLDPPAPYYPGVKSKGFRLSKGALAQGSKSVAATNKGLIARIHREWDRMAAVQQQRWLPIHHDLARIQQQHMTILPAAESMVADLPPESRLCQEVLVGDIQRRTPKFSMSSTLRVFNWLTGLKRELRSHVRLEWTLRVPSPRS